MEFLKKIYGVARERPKRVVFPEADEPRIAEAMARLGAEGICEPLVLGDVTEAQVQALVMARGMKEVMARRLLAKPLYRAAAMVAAGEADAMVAGADSPTRRVIEAAAMAIGPAEGVNTASSFFVMLFPDGREMIFADCALNLEPSAEKLADITRASHASAKALLGHSEVAMLSFSTGTSGAGESVERVRAAAELAGFVGPVQGDAALNSKVAAKKGMGAGNANVLIFPSLDAGNIAYKLAQELAGAQALGPILQGFAKPVGDLSRGATVEDIVAVSAIVVALA